MNFETFTYILNQSSKWSFELKTDEKETLVKSSLVKSSLVKSSVHAECVMDLIRLDEVIIKESLLTTFEVSIIFEAVGALAKICSSIKPNHHNQV